MNLDISLSILIGAYILIGLVIVRLVIDIAKLQETNKDFEERIQHLESFSARYIIQHLYGTENIDTEKLEKSVQILREKLFRPVLNDEEI